MKRRAILGGTIALLIVLAFGILLQPSAPRAASRAGDMGALFVDLAPDALQAAGIPGGVLVIEVLPGGPAEKKGLEAGDIITEYENAPVRSAAELLARIRRDGEGFLAGVRIRRDGSDRWIGFIPLGAMPLPPPAASEIDDRFARLEDELDELRARVEKLEKARVIPRKPPVTKE
jgi:hypothetical protein